MGMLIYDALVLTRIAAELPPGGRILTLGVPSLNFSAKDYKGATLPTSGQWDYKTFFTALGFKEIDALDISSYEGANIVGDLNDPNLADMVGYRYDLVYDCGTLEHIFDAPTALRTINRLIKIGGVVAHSTPANGFMDHGFWQVSPDLFRTFYRAAGFDILTSALFVLGEHSVALPADQNIYRQHGRRYLIENAPEAIAVFAARKRQDVSDINVALQDYYCQMHSGATDSATVAFFLPFGSPSRAKMFRNPFLRTPLQILRLVRKLLRRSR
jgi:SAM-dependent methyltransferase